VRYDLDCVESTVKSQLTMVVCMSVFIRWLYLSELALGPAWVYCVLFFIQ